MPGSERTHTLNVYDDCITLNQINGMWQLKEGLPLNSQYTLSILTENYGLEFGSVSAVTTTQTRIICKFGELRVQNVNGNLGMNIIPANDSIKLLAAKLELGPVQTLAHKEGDEWILNDPPPNYQQELAKCQRYQVELLGKNQSGWVVIGMGDGRATNRVFIYIPLPVPLKGTPTISYPQNMMLLKNGVNQIPITSMSVVNVTPNMLQIQAYTADSSIELGAFYTLAISNDGTYSFFINSNL